ncbi:hypothetical protein [Acanthopleuribacter pedis]|uniref:Tyrosine specific protein phosphatases domain-containing protein n=1 Tax=Acanthopleuribacter pedis TaxID=442870 RepID=A0A8J7Q6X0_9BACT|nr:hypothetical protein [Acanthopleuribacter pedis]MBO1319336.1 hypothetical protein [Acanthopleuribacter pedis]
MAWFRLHQSRFMVASFFSLLTAVCFWQALATPSETRQILWAWLCLNTNLMSLAYWLNRPRLILGKTRAGRINPLLLAVNLPWLLFSWVIWWLQQRFSREPALSNLGTTGWAVGCYPGRRYPGDQFDVLIDLTAEFPRASVRDGNYFAIPNLDAVALTHPPDEQELHRLNIGPGTRVLVHCAQGHGRSATWCALAFRELGWFAHAEEAHRFILEHRPKAQISTSQRAQFNQKADSPTA